MNSRERVFAIVAGQPVDRRPVAPLLSLYGATLTDCPLEKYYTDSAAYIAGQCAVHETFSPDVLFGPFCFAKEGLPFGTQIKYYPDQPPNMTKPAFRDCGKIADFEIGQLLQHPTVQYQEQVVAGLIDQFGNEVAIAPIMISPLDLPAIILGVENWLQALLFEQEVAKTALEVCIPYFVKRCNRLFALGAPLVIISGLFVNPSILTYGLVESIAMPILSEAFSKLQGPVVLHSGGALIVPFLDLLSRLPQVAGFVLNPGEDPLLARGKIAAGQILDGNIDGPALHQMTSEAIYNQTLELLQRCKNDPHFLLGTSGADIRLETPPANIHALLRAARAAQQPSADEKKLIGIACGVFGKELKHLQAAGEINFPIVYLDSMLHMQPKKLETDLTRVIEEQLALGNKIILLYGDCHARMFQAEQPGKVVRLEGSNCIEIVLGKQRYRKIRKQKSFVLLSEWIHRWERVFCQELGFNQETARMFMPEHHSELLYLDDGCEPLPTALLDECADFCGLPWRAEQIDYQPLLDSIATAINSLNG